MQNTLMTSDEIAHMTIQKNPKLRRTYCFNNKPFCSVRWCNVFIGMTTSKTAKSFLMVLESESDVVADDTMGCDT